MILEFHFLGFRTFLTRQPFSLHAPPPFSSPSEEANRSSPLTTQNVETEVPTPETEWPQGV